VRLRRAVVGSLVAALGALGAPTLAGANARPQGATGTPVRVMTMGDFGQNPEWPAAVRARFRAIDKKGGIRDAAGTRHEVQVLECNTKFDADATSACAARAVSQRVAAVVGMSVANGRLAWPALEAAGIPVVGARINTESDVTSPVSFPIGSGVVGVFTAMPQLLAQQGSHEIALVVSDFGDATASAISLVGAGLARAGVAAGPTVRIPLGVRNLDPYVRPLIDGNVDGVVAIVAGPLQAPLLQKLRDTKLRGHVVVPVSSADQLTVAMGDDADGTFAVGEFFTPWKAHGVRGLDRFRADVLADNANLTFDEGSIAYWLSAWVFEHVATGLPQIDAPAVLAALQTTKDLDTGELTPPFSGSGGTAAFPRLLNPTVRFDRIEDGIVTPLSKQFFDPLSAPGR
jgi:ABC-type branched-subunit amino acid transport system substrate-binding protein